MQLWSSIFERTDGLFVTQFLLCTAVALVLGCIVAGVYMSQAEYTVSFVVTLSMLPAIVSVVIMMVNGNVGTGVAVAGAFSLVRFRSVPGRAKEIIAIFLAMGTGLILGMGYIGYGVIFTVILCAAMYVMGKLTAKIKPHDLREKTLRITIPEDLNYDSVFDEVFSEFTNFHEVVSVKTTNMGSMYKIQYDIVIKDLSREKEFIDALRCRNGNLEISISKKDTNSVEL